MRTRVERREEAWFKNQTTVLWKHASSAVPYRCSSNCKAPPDFYLGIPWIDDKGNKTMMDGDLNLKVVCRVWDGIFVANEKNSDTWRWFFNEVLLFTQTSTGASVIEDEVSEKYVFFDSCF